jgi:hypothetical protein
MLKRICQEKVKILSEKQESMMHLTAEARDARGKSYVWVDHRRDADAPWACRSKPERNVWMGEQDIPSTWKASCASCKSGPPSPHELE